MTTNDTTRCRVLIVDDDDGITTVIKETLEDEGYRVDVALGMAALRAAEELHPTVILLDLMMPVISGYELGLLLRANPATAQIPIVIMSAGGRAQHAAAQIGAETYLAKPFDLDQLVTTVATYAGAA